VVDVYASTTPFFACCDRKMTFAKKKEKHFLLKELPIAGIGPSSRKNSPLKVNVKPPSRMTKIHVKFRYANSRNLTRYGDCRAISTGCLSASTIMVSHRHHTKLSHSIHVHWKTSIVNIRSIAHPPI